MKEIKFGRSLVSINRPCYVIAEIGHNHQGSLEKALQMIKIAAQCGADAVKFQKRNNKQLYTKAMYNKPYDNENSYGATYGEHREYLEFEWNEYVELKKCADQNNIEFMSTAFDFDSVDFLERLGITSYKFASADLTNIPLLKYAAQFKKPIFLSTGAATLEEIRLAYEAIRAYHNDICLLHCICGYPTEYEDLNLRVIETLIKEFPDAVIGYSGHDNGILASVLAYMLGAQVVEKHFTLNHAMKGTDHKFSLEPIGLQKQIRDLRRVDLALGEPIKRLWDYEISARDKMGKSIYTQRPLPAGHVLQKSDLLLKSPGGGLPPYKLDNVVGRQLAVALEEETQLAWEHMEYAFEDEKTNISNREAVLTGN